MKTFEYVMEKAPNLVVILSPHVLSKILFVNRAAVDFFKKPMEQLLAR